mgnify:FL=1
MVHNLDQKLMRQVHRVLWPSWAQLKYLPRFLNHKEKKIISLLLFLVLISVLTWSAAWLINNRIAVPAAGGEYNEAIIGAPKTINPLFSVLNEVDADLTALIYSSLFRYNKEQKLTPDLAASYTLSPDKKTYTLKLRRDARWSDGEPFTASDVVFTFETIQNPEVGSPLAASFAGVAVDKQDDYTVSFTLKEPFVSFLNALTVGILPEHLWGGLSPTGIKLAKLNLQPIGAGPWAFNKLIKDDQGNIQTYVLRRNENYYAKKPYLKTITFKFFGDYAQAVEALRGQSVTALSFVPHNLKEKIASKNLNLYQLWMPEYTALFFNQNEQPLLKDSDLRLALTQALNKKIIVRDGLNDEGEVVDSPFIKGLPGYYPDLKKINYNLDEANKLLDKKWTRIPPEEYFKIRQEEKMKGLASSTIKEMKEKIAVAIRAEMNTEQLFYRKDKNNKILTLTITTADTPEYVKVAEIIARMWQTAGIKIDFQAVPSRQISKDVFKNRTYQILLYGEIMGSDPDPYAFWHSSQVDYPGLNLAIYVNRAADKILEDARGASSDTDRIKFYKKFQDLLMADLPAVFLYTPAYTWAINKDIKGVEVGYVFSPAERYNDLGNWYTKTTWRWKQNKQ